MNAAEEFALFTRYLMKDEAESELTERYVAAQQMLLGEYVPGTSKELDFVHRHPRALAFLDAGTSLMDRRSMLRQRLYLASALLEASPRYAAFFLNSSPSPARALLSLFWAGVCSAIKLAIGVPLLMVLSKGRS